MAALAIGLALATAVAAGLPPLVDHGQLGADWHVVTLPRQTKPVTRFEVEAVDGRAVLRVDSDRAYGNLVHDLPSPPATGALQWSWRVDQPNPATDLHARAGDDTPVRVCASFDLPLDRVPFFERQLLRAARLSSSVTLPSATVCWVWGLNETVGELIASPFTRRLRYIVLRNGSDAPATWFEEKRDLGADFLRAFGDETGTVPPLIGVIVGADADNTARHTVAHVDALRWLP